MIESTIKAVRSERFVSDQIGSGARPRARQSEVGELPTERLEAELCDLAARLAAGTYELLVLVGEFDQRGTWATWGALSCAARLADLCDIEVATARSQVRVAKALRDHPSLDVAMRDGDISYAKARVLVPALTVENAEELVALAETHTAGRLGAAIAAWSHRNEDQDLIARRQFDARSCSWRTEPDGTVTLTARLTPAAAGGVCAVIDTQVTRASAPAGAGDDATFPSIAQQRADALVRLLTDPVESGTATGVTAEVVVHVREDGNALTDGTPLSDHAVTSMLPDAFVSLLMHNAKRQPVDASPRRRFPTRRQRRVIDERHAQCAQPGCHARNFLQYDHIEPYAAGGPTTVDNLQRLCGPHNRAKATGPLT